MPLVTLSAELTRSAPSALPAVVVSVHLQAGAFELDRRISAGAAAGGWLDEDEYASALVGERPHTQRDSLKALRRLLAGMRPARRSAAALRSHAPHTTFPSM
jgi:hypothetical protein